MQLQELIDALETYDPSIVVREGFESLPPSEEEEDDLLDKAWGLEPNSRLSCQAIVGDTPLVIEIPRYSINMAKEGKR